MKAIIYRPTKSAMQSGLSNTKKWRIDFEGQDKYIEGFIGWTGTKNMEAEMSLNFNTKEDAVNFAISQDWLYEVIEPKERKILPKSYISNFKYQ